MVSLTTGRNCVVFGSNICYNNFGGCPAFDGLIKKEGAYYGSWAGFILDWADWDWGVFSWAGSIVLGNKQNA